MVLKNVTEIKIVKLLIVTIIITFAAKVIQFTFKYVNISQGNIKFVLYPLFSTLNSSNVAEPFTQLGKIIKNKIKQNTYYH